MLVLAVRSKRYTEVVQINTGSLIENYGDDYVVWGDPENDFKVINNPYIVFAGRKHKLSENTVLVDGGFKNLDPLIGIPYDLDVISFGKSGSEVWVDIEEYGRVNILKNIGETSIPSHDIEMHSLEFFKRIGLVNGKWEPEWTIDKIEEITQGLDTDTDLIRYEKQRIHDHYGLYSHIKNQSEPMPEVKEPVKTFKMKKLTPERVSESECLKGRVGCEICNGVGSYTSRFGVRITCNCVMEEKKRKETEELRKEQYSKPLKVTATKGESAIAVVDGLIPEARRGDKFDVRVLDTRVPSLVKDMRVALKKEEYELYIQTLADINVVLSSGNMLKHSYLVSAPNGFSKCTFANTCIANLYGKGKKMVPYKSLTEITQLSNENAMNSKYLREHKFDKVVNKKDGEFSWQDYLHADVVFCYLTTPEVANMELATLRALLAIRSSNGLPTIIFAERPVNVYRVSRDVDMYLLSEIITSDKRLAKLDRAYVVEVKKQFKSNLDYGK